MHYLYRIINQINGKVYIGQTKNPKKRWQQHQYNSQEKKKKQYIHSAISKYGIDNFSYEVMATCKTQEDADITEKQLIKQYDSRNKEFGYNLALGGKTTPHSEETKAKISATLTGVKHSPEHIQANSEAQKKRFETEEVWNKGKQTGNQYTHSPKYNPTEVIDLYQSGFSMLKVAKKLGISKKSVLNTLKSHQIPTRPARGSQKWYENNLIVLHKR